MLSKLTLRITWQQLMIGPAPGKACIRNTVLFLTVRLFGLILPTALSLVWSDQSQFKQKEPNVGLQLTRVTELGAVADCRAGPWLFGPPLRRVQIPTYVHQGILGTSPPLRTEIRFQKTDFAFSNRT